MQFRFTKGKGTTDAIFTVRQRQERVKGKKLYFGFVGFRAENAVFDPDDLDLCLLTLTFKLVRARDPDE